MNLFQNLGLAMAVSPDDSKCPVHLIVVQNWTFQQVPSTIHEHCIFCHEITFCIFYPLHIYPLNFFLNFSLKSCLSSPSLSTFPLLLYYQLRLWSCVQETDFRICQTVIFIIVSAILTCTGIGRSLSLPHMQHKFSTVGQGIGTLPRVMWQQPQWDYSELCHRFWHHFFVWSFWHNSKQSNIAWSCSALPC